MNKKERSQILSIYIKSALVVNMLLIICGFIVLFNTSDIYGVYAAAICSISALLNCIGLTLLLRWHSTGLILVGLPSLLSAVALSITCAGWLTFYFGSLGIFVPYIIFFIYIICLVFMLFARSNGISAWKQMLIGFDYTHFRHIYQLSSAIIVGILVIAYVEMPKQTGIDVDSNDDISHFINNVPLERLDAADVTIDEIVSFEKQYNESVDVNSRDKKITKRIFALKHILLGGLMPEIHNRENLVNICMVHAGAFSPEQQRIIDWYLALEITKQEEWNVCEKANSFKDFKDKLEVKIR